MGLSAALTRLFTSKNINVALAARQTDKLAALCKETGAATPTHAMRHKVDDVTRLFAQVDRDCGAPDVVVYNASARARGPFVDLAPADVSKAIAVSGFGGFLVAQEASRGNIPDRPRRHFFHRRIGEREGLFQSPQPSPWESSRCAVSHKAWPANCRRSGIHVAHFVIDGGIRSAARTEPADKLNSLLDPDAIAANYLSVLSQPRNAWTWEMEMRPWLEKL